MNTLLQVQTKTKKHQNLESFFSDSRIMFHHDINGASTALKWLNPIWWPYCLSNQACFKYSFSSVHVTSPCIRLFKTVQGIINCNQQTTMIQMEAMDQH